MCCCPLDPLNHLLDILNHQLDLLDNLLGFTVNSCQSAAPLNWITIKNKQICLRVDREEYKIEYNSVILGIWFSGLCSPLVCSGLHWHYLQHPTLRTYQCKQWGDAIRKSPSGIPFQLVLNKGKQASWVGWWCVHPSVHPFVYINWIQLII